MSLYSVAASIMIVDKKEFDNFILLAHLCVGWVISDDQEVTNVYRMWKFSHRYPSAVISDMLHLPPAYVHSNGLY